MYCNKRHGADMPVVCLHGFCQSSVFWEPTLDRLAEEGHAALAPDLPGFGRSAGLPGPYTMEGLADAVARLLDEHGFPRVVLVGGSMGGVVAQHFALRHPARLARLLLVATGAYTADPTAALATADNLAAAEWDVATADRVVGGFFHHPPSAEQKDVVRRIALSASQAASVEAARSNARSRTFELLGRIDVPVLIIQGRHDRARTPEHGIAMQERLPRGRLAVLENSGHTPQLEEPDAFHALALPFLTAPLLSR
jgi:pimeloyl-ACP methyl ester carboxylesterase